MEVRNKLLYVNPAHGEARIAFWKDALKVGIKFLLDHGVTAYKDLKKFDARRIVDEPLWKIPELNGKYHGRFYSRAVWERSLQEGKLPSKSGGKWNEKRAVCMLEHVVERAPLIDWLMKDPGRIDVVDKVCIGCVVMKDESTLLADKAGVDPDNVWKRYLDAKIDVYDRELGRWHILDGKLQ